MEQRDSFTSPLSPVHALRDPSHWGRAGHKQASTVYQHHAFRCDVPTQFNTKDSGRRAESLTAMTTHALREKDDLFLHGCTANLPWMTLLFHTQTQAKPSNEPFAFSMHSGSFAPCKKQQQQQQQQPHFFHFFIISSKPRRQGARIE
ncbi:unnamed protein product [Pleuronectes platessa]|uniref:Uncharacterized protein n=1 Tax=Pleuronectes platessa TaxID=8262 RepID=A0A9N7U8T5_PLEPL|nr:unnamed protein product [Pleuronectes platessa]